MARIGSHSVSIERLLESAQHQHASGHLSDAEALYRRILSGEPGHAAASNGLGVIALQTDRNLLAADLLAAAVAADPTRGAYHSNLGVALESLRKFEEATASYRRALELDPANVDARYNLGNVLAKLERLPQAMEEYRKVIAVRPHHFDAHNNLGVVLASLGRHREAEEFHRAALAVRPESADAQYNLGIALQALGRREEAANAYRRALEIDPGHNETPINLGFILEKLGRYQEAIGAYRMVLPTNADFPKARYNEALVRLQLGQFAEGWDLHEWRWRGGVEALKPRGLVQPQWDGGDIANRTILLHAEGGMGDTIQFCRYVEMVAARGARVVLEVQRPLMPLLTGLDGAWRVIGRGDPLPPFDLHCPLLSLPRLFDTRLETIPSRSPYLVADPARMAKWRERVVGPGPHIGFAWSGNPAQQNDSNRSAPFSAFTSLLRNRSASWYLIQPAPHGVDEDALAATPGLSDYRTQLTDFAETAALIGLLDLVITVDTSVAHLAGALGKPTWVVLTFAPDWRWLLDREDCPWYPTMRLFRQSKPGDWAGAMAVVEAALAAWSGTREQIR